MQLNGLPHQPGRGREGACASHGRIPDTTVSPAAGLRTRAAQHRQSDMDSSDDSRWEL